MNKIDSDIVSRCLLSKVRESVDALIELAEKESESSALLALVKNTIRDEFTKAALKIAEQMNNVVQEYNNRECIIAGVAPEVEADRNENGQRCNGRSVWMDIRSIGIRRVGEAAAHQLTIDGENVPGTGMPDELAIRLFRAIDAFHTAHNDNRAAHK